MPAGAVWGGKATLIRLLLGALPADRGSIVVDGQPVPDLNVLKHIGYMPQNDALHDDLSGEDNLKFYGSLYKMDKAHKQKRIEDVLALLDLEKERKKLVRHYSGGMKKRLSLATALLNEPRLLLLDEPTVGIDPVLKRTLALILFAPLLMFTQIFLLLSDTSYVPTIAVDQSALPAQVMIALEGEDVHLIDVATLSYASEEQLLQDDRTIDIVFSRSGLQIHTYSLESTVKSAQAMTALQGAVKTLS